MLDTVVFLLGVMCAAPMAPSPRTCQTIVRIDQPSLDVCMANVQILGTKMGDDPQADDFPMNTWVCSVTKTPGINI